MNVMAFDWLRRDFLCVPCTARRLCLGCFWLWYPGQRPSVWRRRAASRNPVATEFRNQSQSCWWRRGKRKLHPELSCSWAVLKRIAVRHPLFQGMRDHKPIAIFGKELVGSSPRWGYCRLASWLNSRGEGGAILLPRVSDAGPCCAPARWQRLPRGPLR